MPSFARPVSKKGMVITRSFKGHQDAGSQNPGVDYGNIGVGAAILAPSDGKVVIAQWSNVIGYWIGIDFDNGWGADLLHNSVLKVKVGDRVKQGQLIALSGGTGSAATGPHCHWSLRARHGAHGTGTGNVDPEKYLSAPAGGGGTPIAPGKGMSEMDYDYIYTENLQKVRTYAILHPTLVPNGFYQTTNLTVAEGWNLFTGLPARFVAFDKWDEMQAGAKQLFALAKLAETPAAAASGGFTEADRQALASKASTTQVDSLSKHLGAPTVT